jgi:hypothetical protein
MNYSNLPLSPSNSNSSSADNLYTKPLELDPNTFNMMKGFFESRQFDKVASETIAVAIIRQAKIDGYNPLQVIDTLKGMDGLALNSVVLDILNFNRFKTSMLGLSLSNAPFEPIARNIIA